MDELFYRLIKHKSAADVASPAAIKAAVSLVQEARAQDTEKEWKEFPSLGMIDNWKVQKGAEGKTLCLATFDFGSHLFRLKSVGGKLFIASIEDTEQDCAK